MENEVVKETVEVVKEGITAGGKFYSKEDVIGAIGYLKGKTDAQNLIIFGLTIGCIVLYGKLKKAKKQSVVVINVPKKEEKED